MPNIQIFRKENLQMKTRSLLALSLVSLVSLVGCGKSSGRSYKAERDFCYFLSGNLIQGVELEDIDYGPKAVYEGKDAAGNPIYGGGASFFTVWYDTETESVAIEDMYYTIAYSLDETTGDPVAPAITDIIEYLEGDLQNLTQAYVNYIKSEDPSFSGVVRSEGGEDYCVATEGAGKDKVDSILGIYFMEDSESGKEFLIFIEADCYYYSQAELVEMYGDEYEEAKEYYHWKFTEFDDKEYLKVLSFSIDVMPY